MFKTARIKLTGIYLIIIMSVSFMFSTAIYRVLTFEINRFEQAQRQRIARQLEEGDFFNSDRFRPPFFSLPDPELLEETKNRILYSLILVNGIIFVFSGALGYMLAGRTLRPIERMVDEQNRFITDASHELKTPLTSLKLALEVFLRDRKQTIIDAKKLIRDSINEVNKLQGLSESLLALSAFETSQIAVKFENVSLKEIINEATTKVLPLMKDRGISISVSVPEIKITGNKFNLIDLFVIFFDNAIKYSPNKSTVKVTAGLRDGMAEIKIADQGIGMTSEEQKNLFKRFYRSDNARVKSSSGGYGLGLSIAKKIIEAHRGTIIVDSIPKKGSVFTVFIPKSSGKM